MKSPIEFYNNWWTIGENVTGYKSYLDALICTKVLITVETWEDVSKDVKNQLWHIVLEVVDALLTSVRAEEAASLNDKIEALKQKVVALMTTTRQEPTPITKKQSQAAFNSTKRSCCIPGHLSEGHIYDNVRVSVFQVIVAKTPVPFPIGDVNFVGDAKNTFLMWPKQLVSNVPAVVTSPSPNEPRSPDTIPPPKYNIKQRVDLICFNDDYQSKELHLDASVVGHAYGQNQHPFVDKDN
ncbi:hypothetical protein K1719_035021 [Acacia pycnantha]|nr:hypothetical protein K1719_035021 [Acacia pycnantha]